MKKHLLLIITLIFVCCQAMAGSTVDSLLNVLDHAIEDADIYMQRKEDSLKKLKAAARKTPPFSMERYCCNHDIFAEYRTYSSDSALYYLNENINIAHRSGNREAELKARMQMSNLLSSIGLYMEAAEIMHSIDRATLPETLTGEYYTNLEHLYAETGTASPKYPMFVTRHLAKRRAYRDSMLLTLDTASAHYLRVSEIKLRDEKKYHDALKFNDRRLAEATFGTTQYALVAYNRFQLLRNMGAPEDERLTYLILSAISDVHAADREQSSIMVLAEEMNRRGDIKRANEYINYSWALSQSYKTRMRTWSNIVPLAMINSNYQDEVTRHNRELRIYIICVAALALLLVTALIFIYRQMKSVTMARRNLQEANAKLSALNEEYEKVNGLLRSANMKLSESNLIKEVYVAHFFKLCSVYINRAQKYRKQIYTKLQQGQLADLMKMTRPGTEIVNSEVRELHENFDAAFLNIFPDFVESVNELLMPDERIELKPDEKLNTELRILALIRLGIKDSSHIAELLHYSVNTIYNYRSRVKSKARVNRDDFEEMIAGIH